ncbi:hypothetical protein NLI96_g907 [Meripilus lineatus]|uniref:Uncharacterized protein n=1 Tax=Meripilus lineatus TaxID=2056292 RepID=A0AAD5VBA5_9APHY|nr:hypothetical protein NLI96_g907 [Physisporinus lineatus]
MIMSKPHKLWGWVRRVHRFRVRKSATMKSNGADLESPLSFPTHPSPSEAEVIPRKPYLDLDILFLLLFTFLKRRNHRLALLRTCKSLYHFGAHILLQDPITIRTPGGLLSLTSFIQSNPVARIPHLRRIRIDLRGLESEWEQDESWVEALFPWFELLPTLPRLPEIISSFPKLTSLRLLSAGSEVREMLEPLTHSLTKLHLSFVTGTAPTMILSVLEQLGPRLEELHLGSEVALRQLRTTHTNIKSLTLENWRTVDKRSLVNFFPNLRRLSYISEQPRRRLSPADVILHNSNLRVETPASWCSEHLCGDLTTIQLFHPSGHVDHLHATDIKRDNLSHLAGILVNTTPTRLTGAGSSIPGCLYEMLNNLNITHLSLSLQRIGGEYLSQWDPTHKFLVTVSLPLLGEGFLSRSSSLEFISLNTTDQSTVSWGVETKDGKRTLRLFDEEDGVDIMTL